MPFWSWAGTATQSNAAGGAVLIDVTAGIGNVVHILYAGVVGVYGASDDISMFIVDEDNNQVVFYAQHTGTGTRNLSFPRAPTNIDSTTSSAFVSGMGGVRLVGADVKFSIGSLTALAQNDTVQLLLWAWVKNQAGTISVARSGGTVAAISPTVNEVY